MRTVSIALVTTFVFLLSQQLTMADDRDDREERGASQAVIAGPMKCFFGLEFREWLFIPLGGLGIIAIPIPEQFSSFAIFAGPLAEECSELIPSLTEQVPRSYEPEMPRGVVTTGGSRT